MSVSAPPPDTSRAPRRRRIRLALGLVGGLVVLVPIALIVIARTNTFRCPKQVDMARRDIERLLSEVDKFTLDNGGRPPESLDVLILPDAEGRRSMDSIRVPHVDSGGRPFVYILPTPGQPRRIVSYGRGGKPGGAGLDTDIDSTTLKRD